MFELLYNAFIFTVIIAPIWLASYHALLEMVQNDQDTNVKPFMKAVLFFAAPVIALFFFCYFATFKVLSGAYK